VLKRQKEEGLRRKIVGLRLEDKGVPRAGMDVADPSGKMVGTVTSGGYCPSLDANMALCCVETPAPAEGESLSVVIRDRPKQGVVVKRPFYDRKYKK
jgi:aminomethyltransferase